MADLTQKHSTPQDLRQFAALKAVAASGSISGAGALLGWSDTTVNYHLQALETLIGTKLVKRSKRGSSLTAAGSQLLPAASAALQLAERAVSETKDMLRGEQAQLRLGAFPTAASQLLPRITRRLRSADFRLQAHLSEVSNLNHLLATHRLDAALSYTTPAAKIPGAHALTVTPVLTDPLLLAVPRTHRFAGRARISTQDLTSMHQEAWIMGSSAGDPLDEAVEQRFRAADRPQQVRIRTDDYTVALGLVSAGLAVALVPQLASHTPPAGVALVPLADSELVRNIVLLSSAARELAPLNATRLEHLRRAVQAAAQELR